MNIILDAYAKNEANAEVFRSEVLHFIEDLPPKLKPRNADSWKDISAKDIMNRIVHLNVNYYFWRQLPEFKHIRAFKLFTRTTDPVVALIKIMTKGYKVKSLKVTVDFWTYFAFAKTKLLK
jgi:hypothetical protein